MVSNLNLYTVSIIQESFQLGLFIYNTPPHFLASLYVREECFIVNKRHYLFIVQQFLKECLPGFFSEIIFLFFDAPHFSSNLNNLFFYVVHDAS